MERKKAQPIGALLGRLVRETGIETPLMQHRLIESIPEVLGRQLAAYVNNAFIRNQTLHLSIHSSIARQELMLQKRQLIEKLNAAARGQIITDIQFN